MNKVKTSCYDYTLKSICKINYTGDYVDSVEFEEIISSENSSIFDWFETPIKILAIK